MLPSRSFLTGLKATPPRTSIDPARQSPRGSRLLHVWAAELDTKDAGQGLGGIEELGGGNGVVIVGVDGDVDEALLEGVDNGAAGGDRGSRHDGISW